MIARNEYVIIQRTVLEEPKGLIIVPGEKKVINEVISMGGAVVDLAIGNKVILKNYSEETKIKDDLFLIKESDIIAIMEDKDEQ